MSIVPHTIDVVVSDMGRALAFYGALGLAVPDEPESPQVQIATPGGATLGLVTEAMVREGNPAWAARQGGRVSFSYRCDDAPEVDATFARVVAAGFTGLREPWDAPWGQRYAFLQDPDGTRVDLFAAIAPEGEE